MSCKYIFNLKVYDDYNDLIQSLSESDLEGVLSVLFSLDKEKQNRVLSLLEQLSTTYKFKSGQTILDDSPDIEVDRSKYFTTQTFIDSGHFVINGEAPMFRLDMDEYLSLMKDKFINGQNMSEVDAEYLCSKIKEKWDRIAKDAFDLHKIIVSSTSNDSARHFSALSMNTSFSGIYDKLQTAVGLVEKDIRKRHLLAKLLRNVNIEADIRGLAEKIIGHIDYLFVKDDGDIEIYNIKSSIEGESEWDSVKKEKFKYLLALIKRILEYNGIDARHIRVHLVPIKMKYDLDFENVVDLLVHDAISYDSKNAYYTLQKYDNTAAQFIDSKATVEDLDDSTIVRVNLYLKRIFLGRDVDIRAEGIKESAKGWARHNWKSIAFARTDGNKGWEIKFPGEKETIKIDDTKIGEDNEDLIDLIHDREEDLFRNTAREKTTYRIVRDILASFRHGQNFFSTSSKGNVSTLLKLQLDKYFELDLSKGYKWELIENDTLTNSNIVLFRHKVTNLVDVVTITPFDVSNKNKVNGRDNLLGAYIPDMNNSQFTLLSTYGNIEAVKTLTLLNEVLPKLSFKPQLGQLKILSATQTHKKKGCEYDLGKLTHEFGTIVQVVNSNYKELNMPNNFKNISIIDPSELFIQSWKEAIAENPEVNLADLKNIEDDITLKFNIDGSTIDGLESIKTKEGKIEKLEIIIDKLKSAAMDAGVSLNAQGLRNNINSNDHKVRAIAKVYVAALRALNMYHGDLSIDNEEFSMMSEYLSRPLSIPNSNVRVVGYMFQKSIDKIANTMLDRYAPIKEIIRKYYKDCGYTAIENSTIGNLVKVFKNLYALDPVTGQKTMQFKNPYNPAEDLETHERQFLKDILWELNKVRAEMRGSSWDYTSKDDSRLINDINNIGYLLVPLERASTATRRSNIKNGIKEFGKRWFKRIMHPKDAFKEFSEELLSDDEKLQRDDDVSNLLAYNPFLLSDISTNHRSNYIDKKGVDYFETNVENLMIDFLEKHIQSVEYNKMLTRTKGILLDLKLRGETEGDPKAIEHTVKTIEDFLSVSVYNRSIMEDTSLAIEGYLQPIRSAVSTCYIAGNVAGAVRDTLQGLLESTTKALTKFQTNIGLKDVAFGYSKVVTECSTNVMSVTKLNQMNLKWRISNLDVARISEGLKTGRSGIINIENWAYSTMRRPDYINRMVLLVAQMHKDGVYDAYTIKDGKLVYDWKLDKRFNIYLSGDKSNPEYAKLRSQYLSLLRLFNLENGTKLVEGDALPDAYTLALITTMKTFSDNVYGSYNLSTKWKFENTAIGRNFAVFSTWLNGIVDVYTKERLVSRNETKWQLEKDANGQLLYFDEYMNVVPESDPNAIKELPVMTDVPIMVLGCWYTITDTFKELKNGGWDSVKNNIWTNEVQRRNWRRIWTDMLVTFLIAAIFKTAISSAYKDHKATAKGENLITNGIIEVLYKGANNCWDGFQGPLAVLDYFGNSTNPATYKLSAKWINDAGGFLFGDKTFGQMLIGSQALPRSFKESYDMWVRDQK